MDKDGGMMKRQLSMTANAIRKRNRINAPVFHSKCADKNKTLCQRALFGDFIKVNEENITCKQCFKLKRGLK